MNRCKKTRILIPISFYSELNPNESEKLRRHLKTCEECREEYKATIASLNGLLDNKRAKLEKEEFIRLEEMIKNKISRGIKEKFIFKERGISLSYALLMVILLISAVLALKNPASYKESDLILSPSIDNSLLFHDAKPELRNGFLCAIDPAENGEYSGNSKEAEIVAVISNLVSIVYTDKDSDVRKSAIIALSQIGTPSAMKSLLEISRSHSDPATRIEAIRCLAHISKDSYERRHLFDI